MSSVKTDTRVLDNMIRTIPGELALFMDKEAETIKNNIKLSFGSSPPGRTYKRGSGFHVASIPRFPPNVDMGLLRSRIRWEREGPFTRLIFDGVDYGVHLELGTSTIAPRPFMVPEMMKAFTRLVDDLKKSRIFE